MNRLGAVVIVFVALFATRLDAHEVPDRVHVEMFVKTEGDRFKILVRMPANALIDYLLPTAEATPAVMSSVNRS